jgi:hypothetical protein
MSTNQTIQRLAAVVAAMLMPAPALAQLDLHLGYYSGPATLYPYDPVYCDRTAPDGNGPCFGVMIYTPKSAPLPADKKWCEWADISMRDLNKNWFQWLPRTTAPDKVQYEGAKVCYLEDKGQPMSINDFKRDGK